MKHCPNCGSEIKENEKFCGNCGQEQNNIVFEKTKTCKYCMSKINKNAKVCPNCKRDLRFGNNPIWLIPIIIMLVIGLYCFLSPNAPLDVREFVCGIGLRHDTRYCSYFIWER